MGCAFLARTSVLEQETFVLDRLTHKGFQLRKTDIVRVVVAVHVVRVRSNTLCPCDLGRDFSQPTAVLVEGSIDLHPLHGVQRHIVAVLIHRPVEVKAVATACHRSGVGVVNLVLDCTFGIAITEELCTVVLDITRRTQVGTTANDSTRVGNRVAVAVEGIVTREIRLVVELVGTHSTRGTVVQLPRDSVTLQVVRVVVGHGGIALGGREIVVGTCQLVPRIVGQSVVVLVLHHHHSTRLGPHTVQVGNERVTMDGKVHTVRVVRVVDDRFGELKYDVAAEAAQRYHTAVLTDAVTLVGHGERPDKLTRCRQALNHFGSIRAVHLCGGCLGYHRHARAKRKEHTYQSSFTLHLFC